MSPLRLPRSRNAPAPAAASALGHTIVPSAPAPSADAQRGESIPLLRGLGEGIDAHLAAAALLKKSDGPEGTEPLVGPAQAARVREVFASGAAPVRTTLHALFVSLDGPGAAVARALLLRATAARSHALVGDDAPQALETLRRFAAAMHGLSSHALRTRATVLDLDSTKNTGTSDPQALWNTRGTIHDARAPDTLGNNDGLFQRFTGSCGPTAVQMMLAEADPVLAFAIHDAGLTSDSSSDATATFQRLLLEHYGGGKSLGRVEAYTRARIGNGLGRLVQANVIADADRRALNAHLFDARPMNARAAHALEAVRARYGFPDDGEVERLRARPWPSSDDGITTEALVEILNTRCGQTLGVHVAARVFGKGHVWRHLDDVIRTLKSGVDVPFGCSDPGHWMLLSAVKGRKPNRQLLVSDPDGGRTVWVAERSFTRGTFLTDDLHLAKPGQRPWVDSFLLPVKAERPS